jgi:hypothetical protein
LPDVSVTVNNDSRPTPLSWQLSRVCPLIVRFSSRLSNGAVHGPCRMASCLFRDVGEPANVHPYYICGGRNHIFKVHQNHHQTMGLFDWKHPQDYTSALALGTLLPIVELLLGSRAVSYLCGSLVAFMVLYLDGTDLSILRMCNDTMVPLLFFISPYQVCGALYAVRFTLVLVNHLEGTRSDEEFFYGMATVKRQNFGYFVPYLAYLMCKPPWTLWTFFWVLPKSLFCLQILMAVKYLDDTIDDYHDIHDRSLSRVILQVYEYTHFALSRAVARRIRAKLLSRTPPPVSFRYRALESPRTFRLLRIRPGLLAQLPFCDVENHILDSAPPFEALSYTWGNERPSVALNVGGCCLLVTEPVRDFIIQRRSAVSSVYVWIDAICINQTDKPEKNVQLPLMTEIYRLSSRVIVWLSRSQDTLVARQARLLLYGLSDADSIHLKVSKTRLRFLEKLFSVQQEIQAAYVGLATLFNHPWFERVWVLQEVAVGGTVHVMWNGICIDWSTLARAATTLRAEVNVMTEMKSHLPIDATQADSTNAWPRLPMHVVNVIQMDTARSSVARSNMKSLYWYLCWTAELKATDPRDKVFALFGISQDCDSIPFSPKYEDSVEDVFIKTSVYLLSGRDWFEHLARTGCGYTLASSYGSRTELQSKLPSWATDFNATILWGARFEGQRLEAEGDSGVRISVMSNFKEIRLDVAVFDEIKELVELSLPHSWAASNKYLSYAPEENAGQEVRRFWLTAHCAEVRAWYERAIGLAKKLVAVHAIPVDEARSAVWLSLMLESDISEESVRQMGRPAAAVDLRSASARRIFEHFISEDHPEIESQEYEDGTYIVEGLPIREAEGQFDVIWCRMGLGVTGRLLCLTANGRIGIVPPLSSLGDNMAHIRGGCQPGVLRPLQQCYGQSNMEKAQWVGTCYVHGVEDMYRGHDWTQCILV